MIASLQPALSAYQKPLLSVGALAIICGLGGFLWLLRTVPKSVPLPAQIQALVSQVTMEPIREFLPVEVNPKALERLVSGRTSLQIKSITELFTRDRRLGIEVATTKNGGLKPPLNAKRFPSSRGWISSNITESALRINDFVSH